MWGDALSYALFARILRFLNQGYMTMRLHKLFVLIVVASGAAHAGENLLSDGNFATGPVPPWTPVPVALVNTLIANDGQPLAPSAEITTSVSGPSGQGLYQCIPIVPGTVYRLSAHIKRTSASTTTVTNIGLAAAFYTGVGCTGIPLGLGNATVDPNTLATNAWTTVTSVPTAAPGGTQAALVGLGANGANNAVYTFRADSAFFGLNDVLFNDGFEG
jgi:hypothetical protein